MAYILNPDTAFERLEKTERILKALAGIPVNWDHTGRRSEPMLIPLGNDLRRVGRLVIRTRLYLDSIGARKAPNPKPPFHLKR